MTCSSTGLHSGNQITRRHSRLLQPTLGAQHLACDFTNPPLLGKRVAWKSRLAEFKALEMADSEDG